MTIRSISEQYDTNRGGSGFGEAVKPHRHSRCAWCAYGGPHTPFPTQLTEGMPARFLCGSCLHEIGTKPDERR